MTNTAPSSDMRRGRAATEVTDVEVKTAAGRVRGRSVDGVARFLGVPFAAPPVGPLRFAAPAPAAPWAGVRDATAPGPNAPQPTRSIPGIDLAPIIGRGWRHSGADPDDYLTVDVWTPDPGGAGLPVLVFVHGGAFIAGEPGSPTYDGTALARAGVVLVAVTYRLGVEGFVAFDGGASNVGLRDQLAALSWVQRNVAAFGGDPGRVTVFGESGGRDEHRLPAGLAALPGAVRPGDRAERRGRDGPHGRAERPVRRRPGGRAGRRARRGVGAGVGVRPDARRAGDPERSGAPRRPARAGRRRPPGSAWWFPARDRRRRACPSTRWRPWPRDPRRTSTWSSAATARR
jgi:hypothetical protein